MEQVVEQFRKYKLHGLLVVGGFEVSHSASYSVYHSKGYSKKIYTV